jgi:hypothetical protein
VVGDPAKNAQAGSGDDAGAIGDAVQPFTDALVAAAKTAGNEPAGDPAVSTSVQLGWLVADVLDGRAATPYPGDLGLPPGLGYVAQAIQLKTLLVPLKLDSSADAATVADKLTAGSAAQEEALVWQPKLAAALVGADIRFAKAYGVGRHINALANGEATLKPSTPLVNETISALDDLSTALPPHAARGVANSIRRWQASTINPPDGTLASQCELWRVILTGEKKATELLEPENYLDAGERLAVKLRATATSVLKQYLVWVVLIGVLFVAGICALIFAPKHPGTTAAGLSGVLAALGLTWKGIGGTLGKLAAKLETPLWGAEVDGAVTDAVTLIHQQPSAESVRVRRDTIKTGDYANRAARASPSPPVPAE